MMRIMTVQGEAIKSTSSHPNINRLHPHTGVVWSNAALLEARCTSPVCASAYWNDLGGSCCTIHILAEGSVDEVRRKAVCEDIANVLCACVI